MSFRRIEREDASELVLRFLAWAVASILITRLYLYLSPLKQISFSVWHIAHVLWGGLFMLIGFLIFMAYEGRRALRIAVVIGGIGWGLFIDEVGKYLTRDNNYWFRPAIIFIYVSFIILFLIYRYLEKERNKSIESEFYDLLGAIDEIVNNDLEKKEKKYYLDKADYVIRNYPDADLKEIAVSIRRILKRKTATEDKKSFGSTFEDKVKKWTEQVYQRKYVKFGLWLYTVYWGITKAVDAVLIITSPQKAMAIQRYFEDYNFTAHSDFYMISFKIFFDCVAAAFLVIGASLFWTKKRQLGLQFYRNGLLVSIFLSSIFKFYFEQFSGVFDLALSATAFYLIGQYNKQFIKKGV